MRVHSIRHQIFAAVFVIVGIALSLSHSAHAISAQNVSITPSSTAIVVAPGGSSSGSFDVINQGDTNFSIDISSSPYHVEGLNYDPKFTQLPGTVDASKWVKFSGTTTQNVAAHKLVGLDYTVNVPAGTPAGGYYAVLFAETTPIDSVGSGVVAHNRVGDILYITVSGAIKVAGSVEPAPLPIFTMKSSLPVGVIVSNAGGVHFVSTAKINVNNLIGRNILHASLDRYVLPQTKREIDATLSTNAPIGIYQVIRSSTVAGTNYPLANQWLVIVQPWVVAIIAGLIAVAVGAVVIRLRRRR